MIIPEAPYIKPIEKLSELLDLVHADSEWGKRLALLDEYEKRINSLLKRYSDVTDAARYLSSAKTTLEAANTQKENADKYWEERRAEHKKIIADLDKRIDTLDMDRKKQLAENDAKVRELAERDRVATARETKVAERENAVKTEEAKFVSLKTNLAKTQEEYETRLRKIKEATA